MTVDSIVASRTGFVKRCLLSSWQQERVFGLNNALAKKKKKRENREHPNRRMSDARLELPSELTLGNPYSI